MSYLKRYEEAERWLLTAYEELTTRSSQSEPVLIQQTLDRIIELYEFWGKPEQAAAWRAKLPTTAPTTAPMISSTTPTTSAPATIR